LALNLTELLLGVASVTAVAFEKTLGFEGVEVPDVVAEEAL
jgi:hypothetical protein